jgi:hypothetical protein
MRSQFTGYVWAANQYGIKAAGTIVRGVSILKTKYDTQQAITYRAPHEVARWEDQTCRDIERMIAAWKTTSGTTTSIMLARNTVVAALLRSASPRTQKHGWKCISFREFGTHC